MESIKSTISSSDSTDSLCAVDVLDELSFPRGIFQKAFDKICDSVIGDYGAKNS